MKVLIVYNYDNKDNLFVPLLYETIHSLNIDIQCSEKTFWETDQDFDIIHFQWPEEVVGWNCQDPTIVDRLKERINHFKLQGTKIAYTCHNLCPHYANSLINEIYNIIETNTDLFIHMGKYSYEQLRPKYPTREHTIIPHHIYEHTYDETISIQEARYKLNIPIDSFVITAFGKFRNRKESMMLLKAYFQLNIKHKYLLAPRLYPFSRHPQGNPMKKIMAGFIWKIIIPLLNKLFQIQGDCNEKIISNEDLPYYLSASDVIFIQRKQILNSGNIPLAFLFRKVVTGPDTGNVGELLKNTHNPLFDPEDTQSIIESLKKAYALNLQHHGENNYQYAIKNFNLVFISEKYADAYRKLILNKSKQLD